MTIDQRLIDAVKSIIEQGSCAVAKPVRAGFTTSSIKACEQQGLTLLVLSPTRRILKETVSQASVNETRIPGNIECPQIQDSIRANPLLEKLPLVLPDCGQCNAAEWCGVRKILRVEDLGTVSMTYAKLEAIMHSQGETASKILSKLSKLDVILLDESHQLALPSPIKTEVARSLIIPGEYRAIRGIYKDWLKLCQSHEDRQRDLIGKAELGHASKYLCINLTNQKPLTPSRKEKAWDQLRQIAIDKAMSEKDIVSLRDIITILSSTELSMAFISGEGKEGSVCIMTGQTNQYRAINEFLTKHVPNAIHIYASGTQFEPHSDYFPGLSGKEVKKILFPDIRKTTAKMTLVPDRWTLTSINFNEKLPIIIETIRLIAAREKQPVYLIATSRKKKDILKEKLTEINVQDILIDYYRSDLSIGVQRDERVCISVGLAETPANSCDALARGLSDHERWLDSRRLRKQGVDASTWQAVNRVRDPKGEEESRVYFIGCRQEQIQQVATWGVNRQLALREIKKTQGSRGEVHQTPIFNITVDEPIDLPPIYTEGTNRGHSERRRVSDYIKQIELYEPIGSNDGGPDSKNHSISSIYNYRENGVVFYNRPQNTDEIISTTQSLSSAFVNRDDCHAIQYYNYKSSDWNFRKIDLPLDYPTIQHHISGFNTVGTYQISLKDMVKWCCIDIDSHRDEAGTEDMARRAVSFLRDYGVPFMLEASGSPGSYHIWVFVSPTRTYNAYQFIRQIRSECKLDCEVWPKQKKLYQGKLGNLVKLPICVHQKTGNRSVFLDPDTFEPIEGPVKLPGIVHLYEIVESSQNELAGMPRVKIKRPEGGDSGGNYSINDLDYCMKKVLEDKLPLHGSEGHNLRVAIVVKAQTIGMDEEETAQLFLHQDNYDRDLTYSKVAEIRAYDYLPWSCDTLRDKCGNLMGDYCEVCPINAPSRSTEGDVSEMQQRISYVRDR